MMKLKKATIHKYKSIETTQEFDIESDITVLVGMNESGKTSILEALAKTNYFESDDNFSFDTIRDYPRKQKKVMDKSGETPQAVTLQYEIDDELAKEISDDVGVKPSSNCFEFIKKYDNSASWAVSFVKNDDFLKSKIEELGIQKELLISALSSVKNSAEFDAFITANNTDENTDEIQIIKSIEKYFINKNNWDDFINEYITLTYLMPNLPQFIYYDDYYMLPSRVSLNTVATKSEISNSDKTAKALLELADIDIDKLIKSTNYEEFIAELEATQLIITDELFKYWSTNKNLSILFSIDKIQKNDDKNNTTIIEHVLDIRVQNQRSGVSLPLANRSKGFNWFFSFLVWFMRIQENRDSTYILLLDEPGLNLHAKAQNDLLKFLSNLSNNYQIIYTTHSPFMIETENLNQVRTVLEKEDGTHISESVQEKDPNTLFPLQAALGYDLAQNLFVSKKNLLVEGIADLIYLNLLSSVLENDKRNSLRNDITIVPVGGADKVATFISLLRGNELNIVCLLDTFTDQSAQARLKNLAVQNIIKENKILFYHDILKRTFADAEDLFSTEDYINIYNGAFDKKVNISEIKSQQPILKQLKKINDGKVFNHYLPANYLAKNILSQNLSEETLNNFENLFKKINKLL